LRPERGPEGVDLAERTGERLDLQLATDGQVRRPVEEILGEVDTGFAAGRLVGIDGRDAEEGACAFAVAGGDGRSVDVKEALFLEEVVDRLADLVTKPGDGAERVRPRPQVGDRPQEFERVALLLKRIRLGIGRADEFDLRRMHFGRLTLSRRGLNL